MAAYAIFALKVDAILTHAIADGSERLTRIREQFTALRDEIAEMDSGSDSRDSARRDSPPVAADRGVAGQSEGGGPATPAGERGSAGAS